MKPAILKRTLRIFPVVSLREEFSIKKLGQYDVIEVIVDTVSLPRILDFMINNVEITKQHVYIFSIVNDGDFKLKILGNECISQDGKDKDWSLTFLIPVIYHVYNPDEKKDYKLDFLWPVKIIRRRNLITIGITILERNPSSFFDSKVVLIGRDTDEETILENINEEFKINKWQLDSVDITKGIKELWKNDIIDLPYVKFKKSRSITTEAMDEEYTLKEQYPDIYAEVMKHPIGRTICKFIKSKDYVTHFRTEPERGAITFSNYPEDTKRHRKVLDLILAHNK